jgi:hypothetical protein
VVTPPTEVYETGVICPNCAAGNKVERNFCRRCGAQLKVAAVVREPWYRRFFRRRDAPVAGDRPYLGSGRPDVTFGSLLRTFVMTLFAVVAIGGVLAYAFLPIFRQGVNVRADRVATEVRRAINPNYLQVRPVSTAASSSLSTHPPQFAADLVNNDYWAADMSRDPQPTLTFKFDGGTDLDALVITNGAGADYAKLARPKTIELTYSDGTGEQVQLKDEAQASPYFIHAHHVTSMVMKVTAVYPVNESKTVALTEVEFRRLA